MKKVLNLFLILTFLLICTSCSSLPKTVKAGDTLVIGRVTCSLTGYEDYGEVKVNGRYTKGIELKVLDTIDNKEYTVRTDDDGYFYLKNLPPHHACTVTFVKVTKSGVSGNGYSVWIDIQPNSRKIFIPYKEMVVNLGTTDYYFDGKKNWVNWENINYTQVSVHFKQLEEKSEWLEKKIYDQ